MNATDEEGGRKPHAAIVAQEDLKVILAIAIDTNFVKDVIRNTSGGGEEEGR